MRKWLVVRSSDVCRSPTQCYIFTAKPNQSDLATWAPAEAASVGGSFCEPIPESKAIDPAARIMIPIVVPARRANGLIHIFIRHMETEQQRCKTYALTSNRSQAFPTHCCVRPESSFVALHAQTKHVRPSNEGLDVCWQAPRDEHEEVEFVHESREA